MDSILQLQILMLQLLVEIGLLHQLLPEVIQVSIGVDELLFDDVSHLESVVQSCLALEVEIVCSLPWITSAHSGGALLVALKLGLCLVKCGQLISGLIVHHLRVQVGLKSSCLHWG